jgi:small subunit ribosomal protein S5
MEEKVTTKTKEESNNKTAHVGSPSVAKSEGFGKSFRRGGRDGGRRPARSPRARREGGDDFEQKVIDIRRVARVVAGGRRFNFLVIAVVGNKKGSVGVATGKASDTTLAIVKAGRQARKKMITVRLTEASSIPHAVSAKYSSARVLLKPNRSGGLIAGSSVRTVLTLAGVRGVSAKILSKSKNKLNNAQATVSALSQLKN